LDTTNKIPQKTVIEERDKRKWNNICVLWTTKVIVVDEPDVPFSFKFALENNGFKQVDTFNDPLLALKYFKAGLYRLGILDIVMPQMDLNHMIG
jgi:PleD family two-component response regulator